MSRPLTSSVLLRIIALAAIVAASAGGLGWGLTHLLGRGFIDAGPRLPIPFWMSTVLLFSASVVLQIALENVRRERRDAFRRRLRQALVAVTLFLGIQGYGLWGILQRHEPEHAATGSEPFILVFAALHWGHVMFAVLVLIYVTAQSYDNRYDHEFYWGPLVCTFFWHALGWVWLCILGASLIAL